ncbi:unnamed protein product [Miscanthus lutarioriparius]|uniref:Uncharacterized protein n=1 Tax=Miscanthus lutarioriparius TaxID=422564 RepID=A0A811R881_9POAL|nr:unnamed protein product [Miscanthus lutarioriparius]
MPILCVLLLLLCWLLLLLLPEGESSWVQATGGPLPLPCGVGGRGRMAWQHCTSTRTSGVLLLINTPAAAAAENTGEAANSKMLLLDHDGSSADAAGQCKVPGVTDEKE